MQQPTPPSLARPPRQNTRARGKKPQSRWWQQPVSMKWALLILGGLFSMMMLSCCLLTLIIGITINSDTIFSGVHVGDIDLGGQTEAEAVQTLNQQWGTIILRDGDRTWQINAAELGIILDAPATASAAYEQGRSNDAGIGTLAAMIGHITVDPVLHVDLSVTQARLQEYAPQIEQQPVNAGVELVNGQVQPTPAIDGRLIDISGTVAALQTDASEILKDGVLELQMVTMPAAIQDASPLVARAQQLLATPLNLRVHDPVSGDWLDWSPDAQSWGRWLVATSDPNSPNGLALTVDANQLRTYLEQRSGSLGGGRYVQIDDSIAQIQQSVAHQDMAPWIRIYYREQQHTIRSGDTLSSIAYDYGIPYPWIQQANPGISDSLSVGQTITIPSPDVMLPLPIIPNKRIVVSISQQKMWAYENGQLKWEWVVSTGISSSPTAPGVFQIQSHEPNAYAGNWNLWMPYFMGVYRPVPTSEFMNGFHGFPTRGGTQLLWTNSLGTKVTYGCILLSDTNVELLYNWAEAGTVVEIQA